MLIREPELLRSFRFRTRRLPFLRLAITTQEIPVQKTSNLPTRRDLHFRPNRSLRKHRLRRTFPPRQGRLSNASTDCMVLLELIAREEQRRSKGVELTLSIPHRRPVIRQRADICISAEQITQRVS